MAVTYHFGRFELNPATRQLLVDQQPAPLGARALDVLLALIERRDRLVTKNELLDLVWPGVVVEENNLQVQISALRKLLGHDVIATIPGRGYRFTLEPMAAARTEPAPQPQVAKHNLPEQVAASFIGREREIAELRHALAQRRLVTLVGVGGEDKTRQALEAAAELVDAYRDGVWLVKLGSITDPSLVPSTVAQVLGVQENAGSPLTATLCTYLKPRQILLILDNCEHLMGACASLVDELLRCAPEVTILATSREGLHIRDEQVYPALLPASPERRRWQRLTRGPWRWFAVGVLALGVAGIGVWALPRFWKAAVLPKAPPAAVSADAGPLSIVVLPFTNLTGDPNQAYVADGLTTSMTTDLSRIRDAFIVNAATAFAYKNKPVTAKQVGKELGVHFVLQGSVQRNGTKIRINAQLADAASNAQLWSDTFTGDESDLFALQDKVTTLVGNSIGREMVIVAARESVTRQSSPKVADLILRAKASDLKPKLSDLQQSEDLYRQALALEPNNVSAMIGLARSVAVEANDFWDQMNEGEPGKKRLEARDLTLKVRELDPDNPSIYRLMAYTAGDLAKAQTAVETWISLEPKEPIAYNNLADLLFSEGEFGRAMEALTKAIELNPRHPPPGVGPQMCRTYFMLGDNDAAIEWCLKSQQTNPEFISMDVAHLAMAYALEGQDLKAAAAVTEFRQIAPNLTLSSWREDNELRTAAFKKSFESKVVPAWRKAGLPE